MSARLALTPAKSTGLPPEKCQQFWKPSTGRYRFTDAGERAAFGPVEHIKAIHPANSRDGGVRKGDAVIGRVGRQGWEDRPVALSQAGLEADRMIDQGLGHDLYVSMQAFRKRRRVPNLCSLGSCYVDIDYHKVDVWRVRTPQEVATAILIVLEDRGIVLPSFIMDTGRGICLVWLHELLLAKALPRWSRVQEYLGLALAEFGADKLAKDAARVFRIARSTNPKADPERRRVGLLWLQGAYATPLRHEFDVLADSVLPFTREQIVSLRAERAARRAKEPKRAKRPAARLNRSSYGEAVMEDLERLRLHRWPGGIPSGERDLWLFCYAMALAWATPPEALEAQIVRTARNVTQWTDAEARSSMGSILRRARAAASGQKISFGGKDVDPRYMMRAATLVRWLGITADEQRAAGLRLMLDPDVRAERKAEQARERRKTAGATPRAAAQDKRLLVGRIARYRMAKEGFTRDQMAVELGVSSGYLSNALGEARRSADAV